MGGAAAAGNHDFAHDLGGFVARLRRAGTTGARPGYRGGSLHSRDAYVREWTAKAEGEIDTEAVLDVWQAALDLPE